MQKSSFAAHARLLGWRMAFAALCAVAAHRVMGPSAPWLFGATFVGFQLGRWLGPLAERALAGLEPTQPKAEDPRNQSDRITHP